MGILNRAARGLRNLTRGRGDSLTQRFSRNFFNPGSWGEDIASGLGIRTRGPKYYKDVGRPFKKGTKAAPTKTGTASTYDDTSADDFLGTPDQSAIPATGGYRNLTGAGYASQLIPYAGLGAWMMSGGEEKPAKDARGTPNKGIDAHKERAKIMDDYRQKKLLGSSGFNTALYESVTKDSQWVKTAVDNMGRERYMQLRKAALNNPAVGQQVHDELVAALAKTADTKSLEKAMKEPYVLPGLARTKDGKPRVVVISPQKGKDGEQSSYTALQFDWQEEEGQR